MKTDRTEMHDASAEHPDVAKDLLAKWQAWADRAHVRPFPTPRPKAQKKDKSDTQAAAAVAK